MGRGDLFVCLWGHRSACDAAGGAGEVMVRFFFMTRERGLWRALEK